MKKYTIEFIGTCLFVLCIIGIVSNASALVAVHIGLALTVLVYMGWATSGGHYNPAVTLGVFLNKKISNRDMLWYIVSQLLWAVCGYLIMTKWLGINIAAATMTTDIKSLFIAEFIFTFALASMVLYTAVNMATAGNSYFGVAIGGIVAIGIVVVGGVSGWFFNPAVLLGIGMFGISVQAAITIVIAQMMGASWAALLYRYVVKK